jgi:hypothetical protein
MKRNIFHRMVVALLVSTVSLGGSLPTLAQQQPPPEQNQQENQDKKKQKNENKAQKKQELQKQQQQQQQQLQQQDKQQRKAQGQQRLSEQEQQQRISQQQQRLVQYREHLDQQERLAQQHAAQLQQQKRTAQYRFQQQYFQRLRQQQLRLQNERNYNYGRDPFFYTPPSYRYVRGGRYYETNQYGANLLRQAVNYGYEEGFRAGQADRQDHWGYNFEESYAYRDANYGYSGYYVERDDYNYYFREGFRRGYQDGYYGRYQYGRRSNGKYVILGAVLGAILVLEALTND